MVDIQKIDEKHHHHDDDVMASSKTTIPIVGAYLFSMRSETSDEIQIITDSNEPAGLIVVNKRNVWKHAHVRTMEFCF